MKKAPFTVIHEKNDHKNHVGCLSKSIKKADQDLENIRFYSLGSPTEKQSTLVFMIIFFMYYCEWGTSSMVALPVLTVFQLASQDYKTGCFRGPDLLF